MIFACNDVADELSTRTELTIAVPPTVINGTRLSMTTTPAAGSSAFSSPVPLRVTVISLNGFAGLGASTLVTVGEAITVIVNVNFVPPIAENGVVDKADRLTAGRGIVRLDIERHFALSSKRTAIVLSPVELTDDSDRNTVWNRGPVNVFYPVTEYVDAVIP